MRYFSTRQAVGNGVSVCRYVAAPHLAASPGCRKKCWKETSPSNVLELLLTCLFSCEFHRSSLGWLFHVQEL